jgi:hypothetical protein
MVTGSGPTRKVHPHAAQRTDQRHLAENRCERGEMTTLKVAGEVTYFTNIKHYTQMAVQSSTSSTQYCSHTTYAVHRHTCTLVQDEIPVRYARTRIGVTRKSSSTFQCCGSGIFIPDPNFPSRIPDPGSKRFRIRLKEFK